VSSPQRVLLTGATGHVGGRLFKHLVSLNRASIRVTIRSTPLLPEWASSTDVVVGDLSDSSVRRTSLHGVDTVVHLATRGFSTAIGPTESDLLEERKNAKALIRDAVVAGVSHFVFLSSIHVYGDSLVGLVTDETPPAPNTAYAKSRQHIEDDLFSLTAGTKTNVSVVRLTNSFGVPVFSRPETWNLLVHDLCRQVLQSSQIVLRSDARTCRDIMALRDVVEVLGQLIYRDQVRNEVFLLASGHSMPIGEIAELVQKSARDVLGIATSITQNFIDKEIPPVFTLEPRKIRDVGVTIPNSRDDEIRELLLVAEQHFGRVSS
jgi:UDP-glucose 4-epimerase